MTTIQLTNQLTSLEKIFSKNRDTITFKDIISLIFYAIDIISYDESVLNHIEWKILYKTFEGELIFQNSRGWPQLAINRNDYLKRMDVYFPNETYIKSNNILILLLRLLHVENYKRAYVYSTYGYYKILSHKIAETIPICIQQLSLKDLFDILKLYIMYYLRIYSDDIYFEHQLGKSILKQLE